MHCGRRASRTSTCLQRPTASGARSGTQRPEDVHRGIIMNHGNISPEIAKGLKVLQARIAKAEIPSSKLNETLNTATWTIREFGKKARSEAAIHYIAEILGQFDLISIAELRDNLNDLGRVLDVLGPTWRVIYSDAVRDSGGNNERVGFIYDKRAVAFSGFAATANPPREKVGNLYLPKFDWWREPFMASFSAGSFDFVLLAAHAQWGTPTGRLVELQSLAEWIDLKRREKTSEDKDLIIVGDFNIETPEQLAAVTGKGLQMPAALKGKSFGGATLAQHERRGERRGADAALRQGRCLRLRAALPPPSPPLVPVPAAAARQCGVGRRIVPGPLDARRQFPRALSGPGEIHLLGIRHRPQSPDGFLPRERPGLVPEPRGKRIRPRRPSGRGDRRGPAPGPEARGEAPARRARRASRCAARGLSAAAGERHVDR